MRKGMRINVNKSKVMWISKEDRQETEFNIECEGQNLERVESFKYLGTIITSDGRVDQEVLNRVKKATSAYYQISNTIVGKKEITTKTKIQIYNSIIKPIIQYSTESLPLLDKHRSKLTAVEMKYLRRTVGNTRRDRIRNDRIGEEVKLRKALTEVINERQLKWFGHVYRMGEERKVKQVMEMRVEGRKRRGRPRIKWEDTIERIGQQKGKTMVEMKRMCRDREKWMKWTERGEPDA
ncbi:hypothetical protein ANN_01507 [Periplaneta americana]|uniref:Endonuclease-reverse transcriptase n=1 Tax=Periplaneta americana TaxID=6978 RepID=A0ABQ8TTR9_PERAM|nr:hypothetical protein ANN_01507 [Periplaneta americana]